MTGLRWAVGLLLILVAIGALAVGVALVSIDGTTALPAAEPDPIELAYSDLLDRAAGKGVSSVEVRGRSLTGRLSDGTEFRSYLPDDAAALDRLVGADARIEISGGASDLGVALVLRLLPPVLLVGVLLGLLLWREQRGAGDLQAAFRRSPARQFGAGQSRVTFAEVAGVDEARQELEEIVQFLKEPQRFEELGGKVPTGVLLVGPPGTGKTLLARAIAGEAGVPFFAVSGSDFVERYVGVGAARVRDTFAEARENAPAIVFIDEIDAVGRRRGAGLGAASDEREQTLNQLLVEMDGFQGHGGVILIAATNRADVLDPALLRPGRFDRQVVVPAPDAAGRERILALHLRKVPRDPAIDLAAIARGTAGLSGAALANLVNEAALRAARHGKRCVAMPELEAAKDKVLLGAERRSLAVTADERRRAAYHEAGHALVALAMPAAGRLDKVTIVPRGTTLGRTVAVPDTEAKGWSRSEMSARIAMLLAGRIAEELAYGKDGVTNGAADDIREASRLAQRMVTEFGFNERLGPIRLGGDRQSAHAAPHSDATAELIDAEVRAIVAAAENAARHVLAERLEALHRAAAALLEHETLTADALRALAGLG